MKSIVSKHFVAWTIVICLNILFGILPFLLIFILQIENPYVEVETPFFLFFHALMKSSFVLCIISSCAMSNCTSDVRLHTIYSFEKISYVFSRIPKDYNFSDEFILEFYNKFVYDTVLPSKNRLRQFLNYYNNSQHRNIKFTLESEKDGEQLSFLDGIVCYIQLYMHPKIHEFQIIFVSKVKNTILL